MKEVAVAPEFSLVAACCRWPLGERDCEAIRRATHRPVDWGYVVRIARRHRVTALVHNALQTAAVVVPGAASQELVRQRHGISRRNLASLAESLRLQSRLAQAGIRSASLKGVSLAQRAYGTIALKHGRDIDLLLKPEQVLAAVRLLESDGYALFDPARQMSESQRRAYVGRGYELEVRRGTDRQNVELHWRLTENPQLLDLPAPWRTQVVAVPGGELTTLADDDLFAYLAAHGAIHGWFRLKWLADINALIAGFDAARITQFYRHARKVGAGLCAAHALLLCERLLARELPADVAAELKHDRRANRLASAALKNMVLPDPASEPKRDVRHLAAETVRPFLLGRGPAYFRQQSSIALVGSADVVRFALPPALGFIYPLLRVPSWLWRQAFRARS